MITGTLSKPRNEIKELLESYGAKVAGSISGSTDYLVHGESPGSKLDKARKLDVKMLNEAQLKEFLEDRAIDF